MAPLFPKLRGQFAEFLNNISLVRLRLFASPTCVGFQYGYLYHLHMTFLVSVIRLLRYFEFSLHLAVRAFPLTRLDHSPASSYKVFVWHR